MDEKYTFALRKIALLGGIDDYIAVSSRELGDALEMSQQSASKRILELLEGKYITRDLGARKQRIKLTEKGLDELKKEYMDLRFQMVVGHVDNPMQKRQMRHEIARLNTFIHQHELEELRAKAVEAVRSAAAAK